METKRYVAYYRVSKDSFKDGKSKSNGLGLDAQRQIVEHFHGSQIEKVFVETKSAKNIMDRPVLQEAIKYCLENNCFLVTAKLDRLSRNVDDVRSIIKILDKKVIFCDLPSENGIDMFMVTLFAAFAERERELISLRTKQALRVKMERQGKWQKGNPEFKNGNASKMAVKANQKKAEVNENTVRATQVIVAKRKEGLPYLTIANILNQSKFVTPEGMQFSPMQVYRIYEKANA